jgi:hypothetical protein
MRLTLIARVDRPERLANLVAIPGNAALELERAFGRVIDNDIAGDMFQCALLADMGGRAPIAMPSPIGAQNNHYHSSLIISTNGASAFPSTTTGTAEGMR